MCEFRWAGRHSWALGLALGAATGGTLASRASAQALPDAPSFVTAQAAKNPPAGAAEQSSSGQDSPGQSSAGQSAAEQAAAASGQTKLPLCGKGKPAGSPPAGGAVVAEDKRDVVCQEENPLQPILASKNLPALTSSQKGYLAVRDVIDPFNLVTIFGYSGIAVAANSHTAYGPGFRGFGRLTGYSLVEDMQGEFFGTFLIPSLARQDPRYYRMPGRPFGRRLLHAVSHTVVSQHDHGKAMPNYATLLTYPISAELTNLYVPGVQTDGPATGKRIVFGLATDPVGQIVAEFLPDVAKRIHIRVIFVQQILQQVAQGGTGGPVMTQ